jgi:hypothetical protein
LCMFLTLRLLIDIRSHPSSQVTRLGHPLMLEAEAGQAQHLCGK